MSVEDGKHHRMDPEVIELILKIVEMRPTYLDKFERDLLNDRLEAIKRYGLNAVTTTTQISALTKIFKKVEIKERADRLEPLV